MDTDEFYALLEALTGTPVKGISAADRSHVESVLRQGDRELGCSQFNELLLLSNKDRLEAPFFGYFFCSENGKTCRIRNLRDGVEKFRRKAMVRFGNFIYAYRRLSRLATSDALAAELGECARDSQSLLEELQARHPRTLTPELIPKEDTHYVGYLTATQAAFDYKKVERLRSALEGVDWDVARSQLDSIPDDGLRAEMVYLFERLRSKTPTKEAAQDVVRSALAAIHPVTNKVKSTQERAKRNSDIYLTWDHMDVYFATSMRKRVEYEDLFEFVQQLLAHPTLADLAPHLRCFDPTQSFEPNRIDKGLIEALMLKRARCTVYSVQDVDTLGKDSELAATLAQGKAVIAYAPKLDIEAEVARLQVERPSALLKRLHFVLDADEDLSGRLEARDRALLSAFPVKLEEFESSVPLPCKTWVPPQLLRQFQQAHEEDLRTFCAILAQALARVYDKRAATLLRSHPLGLQVNLETGVANGVLVARDIPTCAALLRGVLLNSLDLQIEDDDKGGCSVLRERHTQSVYRVVTKNRKLTNCFWNFYRERTHGE